MSEKEMLVELIAKVEKVIEYQHELREDIKELKKDMAEVKQDVAVLKQDVAVLKQDVAVLKKDVAMLKEEVAILKEDVYEIKGEVSSLHKNSIASNADKHCKAPGSKQWKWKSACYMTSLPPRLRRQDNGSNN